MYGQNDPELYGKINNVTMYESYDNNDGYCFYRSGSALITKCAVDAGISIYLYQLWNQLDAPHHTVLVHMNGLEGKRAKWHSKI